MIPESAQAYIQEVGQSLFQTAFATRGEEPWASIELNAKYDGNGGYVRNCLLETGVENEEPVVVSLDEQIDVPLRALNEHRVDANGKIWHGLNFTITQAGEARIALAYDADDRLSPDDETPES